MNVPWDDLKVAFSVQSNETAWTVFCAIDGTQSGLLPKNWTLCETDSTGSRDVAIFRVEGIFTMADAKSVKTLIDRYVG